MMTTFAALFGGLPLALGNGVGSELRKPLGIAIVGGLHRQPGAHALHDAGHLSFLRPARREVLAFARGGSKCMPTIPAVEIAMNISAPFIRRPVGTTLLTAAIALAGIGRLSAIAGGAAAAGGFPDHQRVGGAAGRQPRDHGVVGRRAAGTAIRPHRRRHRNDLRQLSRLDQHHAAVRFEPRTSTARRATCRPPSTPRAPICRPNLPSNPTYRKVNPADAPIMILALTSDIYDRGQLYDAASTIIQQTLAADSRRRPGERRRRRAAGGARGGQSRRS